MVRIDRITRGKPDPEPDPTGERFKLIEIYVQEPTASPDQSFLVTARPYEFEGEHPSKFATSCPHCGQGIWFEPCDIRVAVDKRFIACPNCGKGTTAPIAQMINPFVNPVREKIAETLLDTDLSKAQDLTCSDSQTVADKLGSVADCTPQHPELEEIIDDPMHKEPSELIQILEESEGQK